MMFDRTRSLNDASTWTTVLAVAATLKAMIAGVGLGLAALGALDVAFAVSAEQWWQAVRPDWLVNMFAATGAVGAILVRIIAA
jgi:hypothetical protein